MAPMVVDRESPDNRVRMPMPDQVAPPEPERAEATSLWQSDSKSFFGDQRASDVGDILTVTIDISDEASLSNESERERSSENSVGFPTFFGYGGMIDRVLPGIGPDSLPDGDVVDLSSESSDAGSGSIARNEEINLRVAAVIIDKLPNGNFVIAGRQQVRVNHELRELRVAGVVRPEDVTTENVVTYDKIAEARIAYGGRGTVSDVQQPAYGKQAVDIVTPY